jgi:hypothetical protein
MGNGVNRRDFLKSLGAGVLVGLYGCGSSGSGKKIIKDPIDERVPWNDVSDRVDNSLRGGFSFDFRDIDEKGEFFGDIARINGEDFSLDSQGYSFVSERGGIEKDFMITSLRRDSRGYGLDLMEDGKVVDFEGIRGVRSVMFDGVNYDLDLETIAIPLLANGDNGYIPTPLLKVNGEEANFLEGRARVRDLNLYVNTARYLESGDMGLFVGRESFRSAYDIGDDAEFTGTVVDADIDKGVRVINGNYYNGAVQVDGRFRIDASDERDGIVLWRAEKIFSS